MAHVVREYGLVPCSVDSHIGEYLPFALDVGDYHPDAMTFFQRADHFTERLATWASTTRVPLPLHLAGHSLEEVVPIIAAMWTGAPRWIMATNVPNRGYLPDVADGAIVEVGATVDGDGVHPETMPPLGEPLAGWVATQTDLQDLVVDVCVARRPGPGAARRDGGSELTARRAGVSGHVRRAALAPGAGPAVLSSLAVPGRRRTQRGVSSGAIAAAVASIRASVIGSRAMSTWNCNGPTMRAYVSGVQDRPIVDEQLVEHGDPVGHHRPEGRFGLVALQARWRSGC